MTRDENGSSLSSSSPVSRVSRRERTLQGSEYPKMMDCCKYNSHDFRSLFYELRFKSRKPKRLKNVLDVQKRVRTRLMCNPPAGKSLTGCDWCRHRKKVYYEIYYINLSSSSLPTKEILGECGHDLNNDTN